jgi:hypothetical protein
VRPVVALDLDGTLVDYHSHFLRFAAQYFGHDPSPDYLLYDARIPLNKHLKVSKQSYRECKLAYRRGQMKRSVPLLPAPLPQADELTRQLKRWNVTVWICTTRPYLSHDEVDEATRHNLRRNGVGYHGIMWGEHKYRELVRTVGAGRIAAVLDDLPEMCRQADNLGLPVGFAMRPHNREQYRALGGTKGTGWMPVEHHEETLGWLRTQLDKWKAQQ